MDISGRFDFGGDESVSEVREVVAENFKAMASGLCEILPDGRELSLCMTKMEEACMWALQAANRS